MKLVLLATLVGIAAANVSITRTINQVPSGTSGSINISPGCSKTDQYGCAAATASWGQTLSIGINATLGTPIAQGSTFSVDAKVDGLIPFKFQCPLCGANCTIKIPVVSKTVSFAMPPCPISGGLDKTLQVALPAKSPVPVTTSVKGSATASDASGNKIADVSFTASLSSSADLVLTERQDMTAADFVALAQANGQTHYGCPPCMQDEVSIQVQGVQGGVCVPKCDSSNQCPTDKPSGASASPTCALQSSTGDKYCALICSPSVEMLKYPAFKRAADAQCGDGQSCKAIQSVGICTCDSA